MDTQRTALQQRLADLPHAKWPIHIESRDEHGVTVWYARWSAYGRDITRWLGEDSDGLIAEERARRTEPVKRGPDRPHSIPQFGGDIRGCDHQYKTPVLTCAVCRNWIARNGEFKRARERAS